MLITDLGPLALLLLIPAIVLLYMVRSRYRRRSISSAMLWHSVRRDLEARQKLRPPPLSPLMLLQILAIAVGVAALVRPALPAGDRMHLVIVMDTSAGMAAADVAPSRFEAARQQARDAVAGLQPGDQVSLVQAGPSPALLASGTDTGSVLGSLDSLRPGAVSADIAAALRVGEAQIHRTGGRGGILLLSDGAFGPSFQPPNLTVPVDFEPIGRTGDNLGITALDVRPDLDGSGRASAFARVANYSDREAAVPAVATVDGLILDRRELRLAPRAGSDLTFSLPAGTKSFSLALDSRDVFAQDDRVVVGVEPPRQRRVLLVSGDPAPIEKVLRALPGLQVSVVSPEAYGSSQGADLVVLDQFVPETLPGADLLIMNPPLGAPNFETHEARADASVLRSTENSPLLDSVDLQSLRLAQTVRIGTPEWAHPVVEGPAGPLMIEGERAGRKIVVLDFDWLLTDLPRMQAFPLLLSNVVGELNPTALPSSVAPGSAVVLRPLADSTDAIVRKPDGSATRLPVAAGARSFDDTEQAGRYTVTWRGQHLGEVTSSFNVNLADPAASDIAPAPHSFGAGSLERGPSPVGPGLQLWPYAALALLALLVGEWAYFTRRA